MTPRCTEKRKKKKANTLWKMKHWFTPQRCVHTPHPAPARPHHAATRRLLPRTSGAHEYSRRRRHRRRNRICWDQRQEIPPSRATTRARRRRRRWWWCCSPVPSLRLWHTTCPRTSKCWNTCIHTCTHCHPPTCFYVYAVWLLNTGIYTGPHSCVFVFFFRSSFFLVRKVIWLASWRNRPASARRRMSQMRRGIIWE